VGNPALEDEIGHQRLGCYLPVATYAGGFAKVSMEFQDPAASRLLVQVVDVLGNHRLENSHLLQGGKGFMGRVRLGVEEIDRLTRQVVGHEYAVCHGAVCLWIVTSPAWILARLADTRFR